MSGGQFIVPDLVTAVTMAGADENRQSPPGATTAGVLAGEDHREIKVRNRLKRLGLMLALDDFGTGYSSLNYLQRFPIDAVEIGQVSRTDTSEDRPQYFNVPKVIALARLLGLTVSEGVEMLERQLEAATPGQQFCPGSSFAPPMSGDGFGHSTMRAASLGDDGCAACAP